MTLINSLDSGFAFVTVEYPEIESDIQNFWNQWKVIDWEGLWDANDNTYNLAPLGPAVDEAAKLYKIINSTISNANKLFAFLETDNSIDPNSLEFSEISQALPRIIENLSAEARKVAIWFFTCAHTAELFLNR